MDKFTMGRYDYRLSMEDDVKAFLLELGCDVTIKHGELYDMLWDSVSVTGRPSGSYCRNRWRAEECICHNTDILDDAYRSFGYYESDTVFEKRFEFEWQDMTIRCYLLGEVLDRVLEGLRKLKKGDPNFGKYPTIV